jgi:hypothetical protein
MSGPALANRRRRSHPDWPRFEDDFVYIQVHGAEALYVSGHDDRCAEPIQQWTDCSQPPDVYVHFYIALKSRAD